ncbi:hypothetical protein [Gandjariella thermophila]|uniref:hypothetical protein n=1 Tax=Gandjariella thermophila TaxID=1931992 RepID=UPI00129B788F|nr:hypothetical protein [Gandjariella thermophila]
MTGQQTISQHSRLPGCGRTDQLAVLSGSRERDLASVPMAETLRTRRIVSL